MVCADVIRVLLGENVSTLKENTEALSDVTSN
jgi:hypothetical protein